jgi:hypothetical protein
MKYLSLIFSLLILNSCNLKSYKSESDHNITLVKEIGIKLPFSPRLKDSGTFEKDGQSFYYFPELTTEKKLLIFNDKGSKVDSVNLISAFEAIGEMQALDLISHDSILCFNYHNGKIALLDSKGVLISVISLGEIVKDSIRIGFSQSGGFYKNQSIYFGCGVPNYKEKQPTSEENRLYNKQLGFEIPHLIEFRNVFDTTKMQIHTYFKGFYKTIISSTDSYGEMPHYTLSNDTSLIVFSWYTDTLFRLNPQTGKIKKFRLHSDFSKIIVPPLSIEEELTKSISNNLRVYGAIIRVHFDPNRNLYYVLFLHHTEGNENGGEYRDFSLAIYNIDFEKQVEIKYDPEEYITSLMCNPQGFILFKYNKDEFMNHTPTKSLTLQIYEFEN